MRLELGCAVQCTDASFGELADVVIDPLSRRVTHLVVRPHKQPENARLVPIAQARDDGGAIALDCSVADVEALEPIRESAYLRLGEFPVADPDWDIGIEDVMALPLYQDPDTFATVVETDPHVFVNYDRIPEEHGRDPPHEPGHVRRRAPSGTRRRVPGERRRIGGHRARAGPPLGRREIVIPALAVTEIEDDSVTLSLTKDEVGALEARRVHRWF